MTKRLIRYVNIEESMKQLDAIKTALNCSIILKDGKVYTGSILTLDRSKIVFRNMRQKKQEISADELCEIIVDVESK